MKNPTYKHTYFWMRIQFIIFLLSKSKNLPNNQVHISLTIILYNNKNLLIKPTTTVTFNQKKSKHNMANIFNEKIN